MKYEILNSGNSLKPRAIFEAKNGKEALTMFLNSIADQDTITDRQYHSPSGVLTLTYRNVDGEHCYTAVEVTQP